MNLAAACSSCGAPTAADDIFCNECGADLRSQAQRDLTPLAPVGGQDTGIVRSSVIFSPVPAAPQQTREASHALQPLDLQPMMYRPFLDIEGETLILLKQTCEPGNTGVDND